MNITILGNGASCPGPGQASSGFLIQYGEVNLLVDCGTGIVSNLQKHLDLRTVSDIVITHMHADHFIDLIPYRYALRYGFKGNEFQPPRLYLPPGGSQVIRQVVSSFAECDDFISGVFETKEYDPQKPLHIGHLLLTFAAVRHYIPSYALKIVGSGKFAYSADTGSCTELKEIASNADLLLCNVGKCGQLGNDDLWGHMGADEAGSLAREVGVKKLLLSHLWPSANRSACLEEATEAFGGFVELCESSNSYALS